MEGIMSGGGNKMGKNELSDKLLGIIVKEKSTSTVVKCRDTVITFWKYGKEDGLRANIGGYSEFFINN